MDLIDRQGAIDHWRLIIDATSMDSGYNIGFVDGLEFCISHLSTMPSAQPERTGKWIRISPAKIYECSICGKNVMTADIDEYHFCHGCGARMEETT